ncbi:hypothetical protein A9P82_08705 [Arachidicoccus ginsenosidimutans]|uniref:hypothetical protein n=1 Tax=Arachidicoccus sp. BS20 TaxID=1850526 RepID=UPI0007F0E04C|nr:hypothetical protein [Arachidicoccus sp. BS20]ANI89364.1 hypothetical protein A9P82_08705 [Arachidicoccus sp. BS20]
MKKSIILFFSVLTFASCNWFKNKAKNAVNKTGEVVGKTGSEFISGVSKGVEKTFQNETDFSNKLKQDGLASDKIIIRSSDTSTDNILSVYFIFNNDFSKDITAKLFDNAGNEYGRTSEKIVGKKGEAKYVDFVFDKRIVIDTKGKITFE